MFSQRWLFLSFKKRNFLIYQEAELFNIVEKQSPNKFFIFQEVTFPAQKVKRTHS